MNNWVLIVDDNPLNLKLARVTLETEGFEVRTAVDAEEAIWMIEAAPPRLILMDIQLPGMDGLELTRRLKREPATARIRIIAVTAYAMTGDEDKALAAGCDGYLRKPFDPIALPAIVAPYVQPREKT